MNPSNDPPQSSRNRAASHAGFSPFYKNTTTTSKSEKKRRSPPGSKPLAVPLVTPTSNLLFSPPSHSQVVSQQGLNPGLGGSTTSTKSSNGRNFGLESMRSTRYYTAEKKQALYEDHVVDDGAEHGSLNTQEHAIHMAHVGSNGHNFGINKSFQFPATPTPSRTGSSSTSSSSSLSSIGSSSTSSDSFRSHGSGYSSHQTNSTILGLGLMSPTTSFDTTLGPHRAHFQIDASIQEENIPNGLTESLGYETLGSHDHDANMDDPWNASSGGDQTDDKQHHSRTTPTGTSSPSGNALSPSKGQHPSDDTTTSPRRKTPKSTRSPTKQQLAYTNTPTRKTAAHSPQHPSASTPASHRHRSPYHASSSVPDTPSMDESSDDEMLTTIPLFDKVTGLFSPRKAATFTKWLQSISPTSIRTRVGMNGDDLSHHEQSIDSLPPAAQLSTNARATAMFYANLEREQQQQQLGQTQHPTSEQSSIDLELSQFTDFSVDSISFTDDLLDHPPEHTAVDTEYQLQAEQASKWVTTSQGHIKDDETTTTSASSHSGDILNYVRKATSPSKNQQRSTTNRQLQNYQQNEHGDWDRIITPRREQERRKQYYLHENSDSIDAQFDTHAAELPPQARQTTSPIDDVDPFHSGIHSGSGGIVTESGSSFGSTESDPTHFQYAFPQGYSTTKDSTQDAFQSYGMINPPQDFSFADNLSPSNVFNDFHHENYQQQPFPSYMFDQSSSSGDEHEHGHTPSKYIGRVSRVDQPSGLLRLGPSNEGLSSLDGSLGEHDDLEDIDLSQEDNTKKTFRCCFFVGLLQVYGCEALKWYAIGSFVCYLILFLLIYVTGFTDAILKVLSLVPYIGENIASKAEQYPSFTLPVVVYGLGYLCEPLRIAFVVYMVNRKIKNKKVRQKKLIKVFYGDKSPRRTTATETAYPVNLKLLSPGHTTGHGVTLTAPQLTPSFNRYHSQQDLDAFLSDDLDENNSRLEQVELDTLPGEFTIGSTHTEDDHVLVEVAVRSPSPRAHGTHTWSPAFNDTTTSDLPNDEVDMTPTSQRQQYMRASSYGRYVAPKDETVRLLS